VSRGDKDRDNTYNCVWPVRGGYCANQPVRINSTGYAAIQTAYNSAVTGQNILVQASVFSGNLNMARNINVALMGGYDCDFEAKSGFTTITGSVTVGGTGQLNIADVIIN
jgi:hypothetical protein